MKKTSKTKSYKIAPVVDNRQFSLKYRPATIGEMIVGNPDILVEVQEHLTAQALLLSGETGTGKTTMARAIAQAINGDQRDVIHEPATERGVDYVRRLQERIKFAPSKNKWIVIVDESHNLTRDAFTALLTLIESPPHQRVLFILCTNYSYSMPSETFNRCLKIEIQKPTAEQAVPYLAKILFKEIPTLTTKEERKKLATKAVTDAQFCMREAMQNLQSYCARLRGKIPIKRILSGLAEDTKDGKVKDNIEQAAGNILQALRDGFADEDKRDDVITYIMVTFTQHDPNMLMARIEGILYYGFVVTKGGKWNWQGKPYKEVFGKKPFNTQMIARLLLEFAQIRLGMREAGDAAIYASARLSSLMRTKQT